jgi:hypothetical protein
MEVDAMNTPAPVRASRVDASGRAVRGSQMQTQLYVSRRADELNAAILDELPDLAGQEPMITWVSPLESQKFSEYRGRAFLKAVGLEKHARSLAEFWPNRGPVWDALAGVDLPSGDRGVILLEAKAHRRELYAGGTRAGVESRKQIKAAVAAAQKWVGSSVPVTNWLDSMPDRPTSSLYQSANRIATLYWLREKADVPAWLVNLYIVDDSSYRKVSKPEWEDEIKAANEQLGLAPNLPFIASVFVPGRDRAELVG